MGNLIGLNKALRERADKEIAAGGAAFYGWPDRWHETFTVRCVNEHVSTRVLRTENGSRCLACGALVWLTFPEDTDGPLKERE